MMAPITRGMPNDQTIVKKTKNVLENGWYIWTEIISYRVNIFQSPDSPIISQSILGLIPKTFLDLKVFTTSDWLNGMVYEIRSRMTFKSIES